MIDLIHTDHHLSNCTSTIFFVTKINSSTKIKLEEEPKSFRLYDEFLSFFFTFLVDETNEFKVDLNL